MMIDSPPCPIRTKLFFATLMKKEGESVRGTGRLGGGVGVVVGRDGGQTTGNSKSDAAQF